VLPLLAVLASAAFMLWPEIRLLDWLFKIALSGTVGIWTNYFAIRMLFRPRRRALFGIQCLIPANKGRLAEAMGQAVADNLLSPDQVFGFIEKNNLIEKMGIEAVRLAHQELDRPERRAWLKARAGRLLQKATAESIEDFLTAAIGRIREIAGDRLSFSRIWPSLRGELEKQLGEGPIHDAMGRIALKLAEEYSPDAARWVNGQIDGFIEDKGWVARQALRIGKWAFRINEEKIRGYIESRIESPSFGPSVLRAIESIAPEASKLMENPQLRRAASDYFETQKQGVISWLETEGLVEGKRMVLEVMDSERFWTAVEKQIDNGIAGMTAWAASQFETRGFREQATPLLRKLAAQVPIAAIVEDRVSNLDLDELESLIYKVTSENLSGIEFLGGVLGCLAGLILIKQWLIIPLALAGAVIWLFGRKPRVGVS
jgi:uncharacterized membrane protein YheB (UPF0754 family)